MLQETFSMMSQWLVHCQNGGVCGGGGLIVVSAPMARGWPPPRPPSVLVLVCLSLLLGLRACAPFPACFLRYFAARSTLQLRRWRRGCVCDGMSCIAADLQALDKGGQSSGVLGQVGPPFVLRWDGWQSV